MIDLPWSEILPFALAIAAAGVVSGLLAGVFGVGGGAVLVAVFYQVFGLFGVDEAVRMHLSVGSAIAIIVPTSISSFRAHHRRGAVDMALLGTYVPSLTAGVLLASLTAASISSLGLRAIFAGAISLLGLRMLFNRETWRLGTVMPENPLRFGIGALIGYLSTLMGIGGGILNSTFMTLYGRSIHQAVATSSGVGVIISVPGTLGYIWAGWGDPRLPPLSTGFVNWVAVALVIPIAVLVTPYGVRLAHALSKRQLEIGFGLFCLFVAGRFAVSLIGG